MQLTIEMKGVTPLLCHNIQLADPDNEIVRQIAEITSKRKKTEEDRQIIGKLEWMGGLYLFPGIDGPALPTKNIRKCFIEAAKVNRQGRQVERALQFGVMAVAIMYEGPKDLKKLQQLPSFVNRELVGIGGKRTMRVRPQFATWQLTVAAELIETVLDVEDLRRIVALAGRIEGIGDNRGNGFGRFEGKVKNGAV